MPKEPDGSAPCKLRDSALGLPFARTSTIRSENTENVTRRVWNPSRPSQTLPFGWCACVFNYRGIQSDVRLSNQLIEFLPLFVGEDSGVDSRRTSVAVPLRGTVPRTPNLAAPVRYSGAENLSLGW